MASAQTGGVGSGGGGTTRRQERRQAREISLRKVVDCHLPLWVD